MKHKHLALACLLGMTACTPLDIYYKPGTPVQRLQAETLDCQTEALAKAPVANEVRRGSPTFVPVRKSCNADGACKTYGGYWEPGEIYTVDVNLPLRERIEAQCMAQRGFFPAKIRHCPLSVQVEGRTNVLPQLSEKSCAIKNKDGSFLIVEQE